MSKDTGGPAFPVNYDHQAFEPSHVDEAKRLMSGMDLRDYFAAKAMQGMFANESFLERHGNPFSVTELGLNDLVAIQAYEVSDAMLAARVKP